MPPRRGGRQRRAETEERDLAGFEEVSVGTVAHTEVSIGPDFSVSITCDSNLLEHFESSVSDGVLTVEHPEGVLPTPQDECAVDVVMPRAIALTNNGAGRLYSDDVLVGVSSIMNSGPGAVTVAGASNTDGVLTMENNGPGQARFAGAATEVTLENNGPGGIDAEDLVAERLHVENSGFGTITARATASADGTNAGFGSVVIHGGASTPDVDNERLGSVEYP